MRRREHILSGLLILLVGCSDAATSGGGHMGGADASNSGDASGHADALTNSEGAREPSTEPASPSCDALDNEACEANVRCRVIMGSREDDGCAVTEPLGCILEGESCAGAGNFARSPEGVCYAFRLLCGPKEWRNKNGDIPRDDACMEELSELPECE